MKILMRSILSLAMILCLLPLNVSAQTISQGQAMQNARNFLNVSAANRMPSVNGGGTNASSALSLAYQAKSGETTAYYVFNIGEDDGFVIAGGDEVAKEILAYVPKGHFDYATIPDNVKWWLEEYEKAIIYAKAHGQQANGPSAQQRAPQSERTQSSAIEKEDIPDLITTKWDQGDPYNRAIPKLVNSNTGEEFAPPTGCVQTATAQVMKYWDYPVHGVGRKTSVLDYSQINAYNPGTDPFTPEFGTIVHDINFEEATYDWANMLNNYTGGETDEQINAVATLMYHVGIVCNAVYGTSQTTGVTDPEGLKTYFGYSPKAVEISRDVYVDQTWEEIIYTELKMNRPVIYSGSGEGYVGHEFILHGYSSSLDMYKVNWGWGGFMDGYWDLTPTSGSGLLGFENGHRAVVRLQPATLDCDNTLDFGDTFWVDGLKYSIVSNFFKTVEVARPDRTEPQYSGSINIPATIHYQGNDYSVIGLRESCFAMWDENGGWNPYASPINEVKLPDGLRYILGSAFENCANLTSIVIPNSVIEMGEFVFSHCYNLQSVTISSSLTDIQRCCFISCCSLKKIVIPEGVTTIGNEAFSWCTKLNIIELPSTLASIGDYAFQRTENLDFLISKSLTPPILSANFEKPFTASAASGYLLVPDESIEAYSNCEYWKEWKNILPISSVDPSMIGTYVVTDDIRYKIFPNAVEVSNVYIDNVSKIKIPDIIEVDSQSYRVTTIGSNAFIGIRADSIILPQYLITIKSEAFQYCSVKHIAIPNSVTAIGKEAFYYCRKLERLRFPDLIDEIPEVCIYSCDNLSVVELPPNVKNINYRAFVSCPNLFTIICRAEDVPIWDNRLQNYGNYPEGTLYVPSSSIDKYRSSEYWKDWRFIKSIDEFDASETCVIVEDKGFQYRLLNHGAVVQGTVDGNYEIESIDIPEGIEYEGKTYDVISIGQDAFSFSRSLSLHLPSKLHSILKNSFWDCNGLTEIHIPDNVSHIGDQPFYRCRNLKSINIPDSLKVLGDLWNETAIETLAIPEGVETLRNWGFGSNLKEIVFPSSLSLIRNFGSCVNFGNTAKKAVVLSPDSISFSVSGAETSVYVPSELVEKYRRENDQNNFFGKWHVKEVLPIIPLTEVSLNKGSMELAQNASESLATQCSPEDATLKYVKWYSSDPAVASVDQNGVVTAHKPGTATISAKSMYYQDLSAACTVTVILNLGDANGDNAFTVSDVTFTASYIMGSLSEGNDFYVEAADLDCDGMVLVNDLTAIIDLVLAADYATSAPALAPQRERVAALPVFEISETNGSAIEVCVKPGYIATQFDVILPEGARLMEASLAGNNALTHKMTYRSLDDSRVRVVVFSMDNTEMYGELISLTVQGEGDVTLTNVLVNEIQPNGTIVEKAAADIHATITGNTSGVSEIESDSPTSESIYNLNGQKVPDDYKGFVIKNGKKILSK